MAGPGDELAVCFATPGAYPMLRRRGARVFGGSELRALRYARALALLPHYQVSMIAFPMGFPKGFPKGFPMRSLLGEPPEERIDGILVIRDDAQPPSGPGLRGRVTTLRTRVSRRARRLVGRPAVVAETAAWAAADADVYLTFGVADYSAGLAAWCRGAGRPLLLMAGSDLDFSSEYRPGATGRNVYGSSLDRCHEAIAGASVIVVQTETQRRLLAERFGRDGVVIPSPVEIGDAPVPSSQRREVLWIGKADAVKRPELAIELAGACPDVPFTMVVNRADPAVFARVRRLAPANVRLIERVPPTAIDELFRRAFALLNTSAFEGFPATFLEAGRHGIPLLSLEADPDGIITRLGAGVAADGDPSRLVAGIQRFRAEPATAAAAGARLHAHVRRHHAFPACLRRLQSVVEDLAGATPVAPRVTRMTGT